MNTLTFEQWLIKTAQVEAIYDFPCECCNDGYVVEEDVYEVEYRVKCWHCNGTGTSLYREYLQQVEKDKKLLSAWIYQNMQNAEMSGNLTGTLRSAA